MKATDDAARADSSMSEQKVEPWPWQCPVCEKWFPDDAREHDCAGKACWACGRDSSGNHAWWCEVQPE